GPTLRLGMVEQRGVADHAKMIVTNGATTLGKFDLGSYLPANERIGQINEAVFLLGAARHQTSDVSKFIAVAQALNRTSRGRSAKDRFQHPLKGDSGIAANVQIA